MLRLEKSDTETRIFLELKRTFLITLEVRAFKAFGIPIMAYAQKASFFLSIWKGVDRVFYCKYSPCFSQVL